MTNSFHSQERSKALVPKDNILVARLEDGFGWAQICPFFDVDVPSTPYPIGNAPAEFQALVNKTLAPRIRNAGVLVLSAVVVPVTGIGAWYYFWRK